jgi:hypothetical protein
MLFRLGRRELLGAGGVGGSGLCGSGLGGRACSSAGRINRAKDFADGDRVAFVASDALDDAGLFGWDLDVDLVRFQLNDWLRTGDRFARLLEPLHNDRFDDRLAERGHPNFHRHRVLLAVSYQPSVISQLSAVRHSLSLLAS